MNGLSRIYLADGLRFATMPPAVEAHSVDLPVRYCRSITADTRISAAKGTPVTGGPNVSAIVGDITQVDTDAIVNAANTELWMGSGVAGAIKRAGGEHIEREAMAQGPISLGEAVATSAGRLPMRAIIHAAAMGYVEGRMVGPTAESIRNATLAALDVADRLGITSIAFPALGTGVGGFDLAKTAEVMVETVTSYISRPDTHLRIVLFVLRNELARQTFEEAIELGGAVP
jgi:O-acetyl-ADP-ribose deacetylase (regulator of RNase III)